MNLRRTLVLAALLIVAWASPRDARADRAAADFYTQRGDAGLRERKWVDAQAQYRKAIEAEEGHVLARVGLGEALLFGGDRTGAIEAWQRVVADAAKEPPTLAPWVEGAARAKRRLSEVEAAAAALARIVNKQADDLVALADRWSAKDSDLSTQALRDALTLVPEHPRARELLPDFAPPTGAAPAPTAKAGWVALFDGKSFAGWDSPNQSVWTVRDGVIEGDLEKALNQTMTQAEFKGDYDVRIEFRRLERYAEGSLFGVLPAINGIYKKTMFCVLAGEIQLIEQDGQGQSNMQFVLRRDIRGLSKPLDLKQWNVFEVRFRGTTTEVLVNETSLGTFDRVEREGSHVGIMVQDAKVEWRRIEVFQR